MKRFNHYSFSLSILTCFIMLGFLACSGTEPLAEPEPERTAPDIAELEALYWERLEQARMNFVQADIDFMADMIAHHAQALIMSRLAPDNGASRSVQTLAARIINAQGDEIELMQTWLRNRGQAVPEVHINGLELMIHIEDDGEETGHGDMGHHHQSGHNGGHQHHGNDPMAHHHDMPGMLTQEQLEELAAAEGNEFDRKFLTFMIEHHEGAIIMVDHLFSVDGAALDTEIFELASGIRAEQVTEIERMKLMLEQME